MRNTFSCDYVTRVTVGCRPYNPSSLIDLSPPYQYSSNCHSLSIQLAIHQSISHIHPNPPRNESDLRTGSSKKQRNIAASTHTLYDCAGMPIDSSDEESFTSEKPVFTPLESLADDTCSERTSTTRDISQDELDRPETSCAPLFDLVPVPQNHD